MVQITTQEPRSENIWIELLMQGEYWDRPPEVDVLVDNEFVEHHKVDGPTYTVRFQHVFEFDKPHVLELRRTGKTNDQNKLLPDGTYQSQTLIIKQVKIDRIDLRNLVWDTCRFRPEYPEPWATEQRQQGVELETELVGETILGHNGVWQFEFRSPVYKFLIDWVRGNRT